MDRAEIEEILCTIWPSSRGVTDKGEYYDFEAEAPVRYKGMLEVPNRHINLAGIDYHIIEVTEHEVLPHVAMRLRRRSG